MDIQPHLKGKYKMRKYFINYGNVEYMTISLDNARKIANTNGKPLQIYSMVETNIINSEVQQQFVDDLLLPPDEVLNITAEKQIEQIEPNEQVEQSEQIEQQPNEQIEQFEQAEQIKQVEQIEQAEQMLLF